MSDNNLLEQCALAESWLETDDGFAFKFEPVALMGPLAVFPRLHCLYKGNEYVVQILDNKPTAEHIGKCARLMRESILASKTLDFDYGEGLKE